MLNQVFADENVLRDKVSHFCFYQYKEFLV